MDQLVRLLRSDTATAEEKHAATRALGSLGSVDKITVKSNDTELQRRVAKDAILRSETKNNAESTAVPILRQLKSQLETFSGLSPAKQIITMNALANFDPREITGDDSVPASIIDAVDATQSDVVSTAVGLLAKWGHYEQAKGLPGWINDRPELAKTALPMLALAHNDLFDREVIARLGEGDSEADDAIRMGMIEYAAERRLSDATPELLRIAGERDSEIATAAIEAAGYTASIDQFAALLDTILARDLSATDDVAGATCMSRACVRLPRDEAAAVIEQEIAGATEDDKIWLLSMLAQLGGDAALTAVTRAAESGDEILVDGATRALGQWLSADVAEPLLRLRVRCHRGISKLGRYGLTCEWAVSFDMPAQDRLELCRRGLSLAKRSDEKILVIDILRRNPSLDAARMLVEIASDSDDRSLRNRALTALVSVAEKVSPSHPKEIRSIVDGMDLESAPPNVSEQLRGLGAGQ